MYLPVICSEMYWNVLLCIGGAYYVLNAYYAVEYISVYIVCIHQYITNT